MLTHDHVTRLTAPFDLDQHEFLRGRVYLREQAVTARLDEVDPSWTFEVIRTDWRAETVIVYARLTVAGITRESNGEDVIEYKKDSPREPLYVSNHPEKAALTDALKRCARLFGVGRYLLDIDKETVKDHRTLAAWLNPFLVKPTKDAIFATLKNHGLTGQDGLSFVLANLIEGRSFSAFGELHPFMTPNDVMKRIPQLARQFAIQQQQPEEVEQPAPPAPLARRSSAEPTPFSLPTATRSSASTSPSTSSNTSRAASTTAGLSTARKTATSSAQEHSRSIDEPF